MITALGTSVLTDGVALDIDDETAAAYRESFLRSGSQGKLVEAATAPVINLLGGRYDWLLYTNETTTWAADDSSVRVQSSTAKPGLYNWTTPAAPGQTFTFTATASVAALAGAGGWWPWLAFYTSGYAVLTGEYSQISNRVTTTGTRSCSLVAPATTALVAVGFEAGGNADPVGAKDFTVSAMSLVRS